MSLPELMLVGGIRLRAIAAAPSSRSCSCPRSGPARRGPGRPRGVHVLLVCDDQALLTRRRDTNPQFDWLWHLLSGQFDADELVLDAAAREADKAAGVHVEPYDFRHAHTLRLNRSGPDTAPRLVLRGTAADRQACQRRTRKVFGGQWFGLHNLTKG